MSYYRLTLCLMSEATGSTKYNDITCDAVVTIVSVEHLHGGMLYKESNVTTKVSNVAPRSCHRTDENALKWQMLGQTSSRGDPPGSTISINTQ